jgi:hypothetical protein
MEEELRERVNNYVRYFIIAKSDLDTISPEFINSIDKLFKMREEKFEPY